MSKKYDRAASFYEKSAHYYSFGKIRKSKMFSVAQMEPGDKVIFLGVGSGEEAIKAAEKGVDVTCVDISEQMLAKLKRKLDSRNLDATLICQDALSLDQYAQYDACAANYFLNVFLEPEMRTFLKHSARLVKPGGKFLIADVARSQGNVIYRAFNVVYLKWAMFSSWMMGLVPLHRNYDYVRYFEEADLDCESVALFPLFKRGPVVFQCIVGRKTAA